ncbi:phage late control D family protein [Neorhizobium galegae]|uniref:phage late control D family protein n=1 Tax=Neorhizobium galegae TaxID=399 RepID=UPI000622168D|nr:contractile injection system protein, VgrG/Pvc8 family [Neorhizobium galegae]CDZ45595.1 Phage late control D family protein [Neorhizobium galegae bv. orientalis]
MKKPAVRIIGQGGTDLIPGWLQSLTQVSFTDNDGGDADDLEIEFAVSAPFPASPAEGTRYQLFYGWEGGPLRNGGQFTYQSDSLTGDAESGYLMKIIARSADFVDADKASDTEHFEKTTVGEIVNQIASKTGKTAIVDPEIASIEIPYRLRYNQSAVGFVKEIAEEFGGTLKLAGGKMLMPRRSGGKSASGQELPVIAVTFDQVISFEISSEGRGKFKDVEAPYFDPMEGVQKLSKAAGIGDLSRFLGLHPARSAEEANHASKAQAGELGRGTISGSVTMEGSDGAMAGAPVSLSGFGSSRDGLDLVASSIQHDWSFDEAGGWLMTIELANKKQGSSSA